MRLAYVNFDQGWVLADDDRIYPIACFADGEGNRVSTMGEALTFVVTPPSGQIWWWWVGAIEKRTIH